MYSVAAVQHDSSTQRWPPASGPCRAGPFPRACQCRTHPRGDPPARGQPARGDRAETPRTRERHRGRQSLRQLLESRYRIHGGPACSESTGLRPRSVKSACLFSGGGFSRKIKPRKPHKWNQVLSLPPSSLPLCMRSEALLITIEARAARAREDPFRSSHGTLAEVASTGISSDQR